MRGTDERFPLADAQIIDMVGDSQDDRQSRAVP